VLRYFPSLPTEEDDIDIADITLPCHYIQDLNKCCMYYEASEDYLFMLLSSS
jgi:hypothetical protein